MQSYGNYSYYGQQYQHPAYSGPGPSNPYPPYSYPYGPPLQERDPPFISQAPPGFHPQTPGLKAHRRAASIPAAAPLKSALKKPKVPPPNEGLSRQATYPATYSNHVPRLSNNYKQYTSNHNPDDFRPLHMFMSFIGNNELRVENVMEPALVELRQTILSMWPGGVDLDAQHGHDWTVKFRNNPWSFQGPHAPKAWEIIVQLFTLFARRGFSFQTTMNFDNSAPRLVFEVTSEDRTSQFFLAYLSRGGRRLTLIRPPTLVHNTFAQQLKAVLPRKIDEHTTNKDLRVFEPEDLRVFEARASLVAPQFFLMHVLKILTELGFNLATGFPLGKKGPFGLRTGRELLVFRGSVLNDTKG